jgi:hypothetical protein
VLTSCPRICGRRSSTASPTGKRGVVVQVETVAVALAASVVTLLGLVIAFTGARDHLANPTVLSSAHGRSQHCGALELRSRCFGVSRVPSASRLLPE